ncbi:MAG TPA: hypothetical protein VI197_16110 [Polyangiaceae bacterium]
MNVGRALAASCALLGLAGCDDLELPTPPDMSALARAYAEPDGELTAETAAELGVSMADTVVETRTSSPIELMGEMVTKLQDTSKADPSSDDEPSEDDADGGTLLGEKLDIAAIVRLHHDCRGWEGEDPPQAGNGTLDITATLDSDGLIPTIWGTATNCRHARRGTNVELDGDIRIRLGDRPRVSLRELAGLPYLVEFEGRGVVELNGKRSELTLHTHFRITPGEAIELLIALPDGTFVVGVFEPSSLVNASEQLITGGLITRDQRWSCSLNLSNASGSCADANDPTSTIEW